MAVLLFTVLDEPLLALFTGVETVVDCWAAWATFTWLDVCDKAANPLHAESSMADIRTKLAKLTTLVFMVSSNIIFVAFFTTAYMIDRKHDFVLIHPLWIA
jgi:hypothetical protein